MESLAVTCLPTYLISRGQLYRMWWAMWRCYGSSRRRRVFRSCLLVYLLVCLLALPDREPGLVKAEKTDRASPFQPPCPPPGGGATFFSPVHVFVPESSFRPSDATIGLFRSCQTYIHGCPHGKVWHEYLMHIQAGTVQTSITFCGSRKFNT